MKARRNIRAELNEMMRWPWRINLANTRAAEVAVSPVMQCLKRRLAYAKRSNDQRKMELIKGLMWQAQNPRPRLLVMRSSDGELYAVAPEFKGKFDTSKLANGELWCIGSDGKPWPWTQYEPKTDEERAFVLQLEKSCEAIRNRELNKTIEDQKKDVERGKKQLQQVKTIAPKGGQATAHYTNDEVRNAFAEYRKRNPGKSAWDAANALIRNGNPLQKWKGVSSAMNRIKRIAKNTDGVSVDDWFSNL
jgi:hypothetical protein